MDIQTAARMSMAARHQEKPATGSASARAATGAAGSGDADAVVPDSAAHFTIYGREPQDANDRLMESLKANLQRVAEQEPLAPFTR